MKKERNIFGKILMVLTIVFFYMPIIFMVVFSFNESKSLTHFTGFSLRWYEAMLKNHGMMESLYVTIIIALLATIVSTFVGTITAIGLSKSKKVYHILFALSTKIAKKCSSICFSIHFGGKNSVPPLFGVPAPADKQPYIR